MKDWGFIRLSAIKLDVRRVEENATINILVVVYNLTNYMGYVGGI